MESNRLASQTKYLRATEILDRSKLENDPDLILSYFREHLHDRDWREVLLVLMSKLQGVQAQKVIQTILDADSEYEKWLHRDLLFAGWCLTTDPPDLLSVAGDLVGPLLDRLVELEVADGCHR